MQRVYDKTYKRTIEMDCERMNEQLFLHVKFAQKQFFFYPSAINKKKT